MSDRSSTQSSSTQPSVYQIRIKGHLSEEWQDWFEGLTIRRAANGETVLTGPLVDQSALHGLLKRVRDLGMSLLAVNLLSEEGYDA